MWRGRENGLKRSLRGTCFEDRLNIVGRIEDNIECGIESVGGYTRADRGCKEER
jgi:hypothetical protein